MVTHLAASSLSSHAISLSTIVADGNFPVRNLQRDEWLTPMSVASFLILFPFLGCPQVSQHSIREETRNLSALVNPWSDMQNIVSGQRRGCQEVSATISKLNTSGVLVSNPPHLSLL